MQRGSAQQRVDLTFVAQALVELVDRHERRAHAGNGIDSQVVAGAVRRAPAGLEVEPHEASVGDGDVEPGRLRDDRGVGGHSLRDSLGADAQGLFVGDRGDDQVARESRSVAAAATSMIAARLAFMSYAPLPYMPVFVDSRGQGAVRAAETDGVHVRIQHQRTTAARAGDAADDVRSRGGELAVVRCDPVLLEPGRDEAAYLGLARTPRNEGRIHGVDRDQLLEEVADVRHATSLVRF